MNEFNKVVNELAKNIKVPEQVISKNALAETIREAELLLEDMQQNSNKFESWHVRVVGDNLRTLKMIYRNLGYE